MNREILFRGLRADGKGWAYGFLVVNKDGSCWIKDTDYNVNNGKIDLIPHEVDPATVGQFTGLTDKKGNKIFDGDKCMFSWERASKGGYFQMDDSTVELKEFAYYVWHLTGFALKNSKTGKFVSVPSDAMIEIIGNIHDNPELLNQ